jgi:hypothetical protein
MSAPGPPWTPEEDALLRSMGAAGESATAIATLLKRKAAGVHQRAHILEIRLARPLPRAEAEVEMICPDTNPPDSTTSIGSVGPLAAREPLKLLILPRQGLPP